MKDLSVLLLELALEKETDQHLNAYRPAGGNFRNHGRGHQGPPPGEGTTPKNARYTSNLQDLFWCDARDEQGGPVSAVDCDQHECLVVQGKKQETNTRPMSTSPSRSPFRPYPSFTPSPRRRRSRSPRHRHPRHHRGSTSFPLPHHDHRHGPLPLPGPRLPRLVVPPRSAGAPPLGEVGRRSGKARRGAHGAYLRGGAQRTPANPNEAAPEAIMPQAAWEALLRDAVQGLRPPYTPQALRQWLQATHPQAWAAGAPSPPRPSRHHHTKKGQDKGEGRARGTKEHSGKRARKGPK